MANEITIQGSLTLQRSTIALQGVGVANGNSTANGNGILNVQSVGTTEAAINIGNVSFATAGYLFVRNLDATNYVEVGYDEAGTKRYFCRLRPTQEFCLLPVEPGKTYYAKAANAACFVQVGAVEAA
jgi:hypothetical protein